LILNLGELFPSQEFVKIFDFQVSGVVLLRKVSRLLRKVEEFLQRSSLGKVFQGPQSGKKSGPLTNTLLDG